MSLPHAILTALLEKPSSGLELTRRFDRSIGYFWSSTHQQIYRELGRLEQAGRIRALPTAVPARGQKKEYEVPPAGREELAAWVALPEDPAPRPRSAAAADAGGRGRRHEGHGRGAAPPPRAARKPVGGVRGDRGAGLHPPPTTDEGRLRHLVLRGGIDLETFWIGWLNRAIADLTPPDRRERHGCAAPRHTYGRASHVQAGVTSDARRHGCGAPPARTATGSGTTAGRGLPDHDPRGHGIHRHPIHGHGPLGHATRVRVPRLGPAEEDNPRTAAAVPSRANTRLTGPPWRRSPSRARPTAAAATGLARVTTASGAPSPPRYAVWDSSRPPIAKAETSSATVSSRQLNSGPPEWSVTATVRVWVSAEATPEVIPDAAACRSPGRAPAC